MQKIAAGIFITCALIVLFAFGFTLYAQFALDYSLESLKQALETSQKEEPSELGTRVYSSSLETLALEELVQKNADFESAVLLEHAAKAIRDAVEESGYARAGFYLVEVLNDKAPERNLVLRIMDGLYYFFKGVIRAFQDLWNYLLRRFKPEAEFPALGGAAVLILGEAEQNEKSWKLEEADRYYREFLGRYPSRPERGFVTVSLAHVLIKMRRFEEAETLLRKVKKEFSGAREENLADGFLAHLGKVRREEARIAPLEESVKAEPDRLFEEDGGLRLALTYLATYQPSRALSILEKLSEAPDPRIRDKAIFYRAWIYKWQGDLDEGKELFELLARELKADETISLVSQAQLAAVHEEKGEHLEAIDAYKEFARRGAETSWKALSELEQSEIYLFGLGNGEAAKDSLLRLEQVMTTEQMTPSLEVARIRLQEAVSRGLRDEAFGALAQGRVQVAFDIFTQYLEKFPRDGTARCGLSSIYLLRGDLKKALEEAEKGYGLERTEYTAAELAYVYEKMGELETAGRYNLIGTQIKPSYVTAQFNLAWVYVMTGRYKEADERLAGLEGLSPQPPPLTRAKILNNRGCTLWLLGNKEEALKRFQEALQVVPTLAEALKNIEMAKGEQRQPALAETSL
jgi:tetratricopeptide (TPR) repeat protein